MNSGEVSLLIQVLNCFYRGTEFCKNYVYFSVDILYGVCKSIQMCDVVLSDKNK